MASTPIPVWIDSRLRLPLASLPPEVVAELQARCSYVNPGRTKLERLARRMKGKKRAALMAQLRDEGLTIETWDEDRGVLSLPRGALSRLREVFQAYGLLWSYVDQRSKGTGPRLVCSHNPDPGSVEGALRWYQEEAVMACVARQNCILRAPTGSGKTSTLLAILSRLGAPSLVLVDSAELLRQWISRIVRELALSEDEIGVIGGGVFRLRALTVGMRQSVISRLPELLSKDYFGAVIVDEVHRAAAASFQQIVDRLPCFWRIGASADETRADGKEFLVYDIFGHVAHEVSREELIEDGAVLDVEVRVVPTAFEAPWYLEQRERGEPDFNRLLDEMTVNVDRNELVFSLVEAERGQVLVLTHRVEHALALRSRITGAELAIGGLAYEEARATAVRRLRSGEARVAVGTVQSMGTGIDLPSVSVGVLSTPIGGNRQLFGQIRGRFCRPAEGKKALLYVLWDQHVSGLTMLRRLIEWNRTTLVRDKDGRWVEGYVFLKSRKG